MCATGRRWFVFGLLSLLASAGFGCGRNRILGYRVFPLDAAPEVRVMSRNLYLGADLGPVVTAVAMGDPEAIVAATTAAFAAVDATDFAARAEALADEIVAADPDVVALQEVALWRVQASSDSFGPSPTPATVVAWDFAALLRDALAARGASYDVVGEVSEVDVELPAFDPAAAALFDVRFTDRDVVLARAGDGRVLPAGTGLYAAAVDLGGGVIVPRGWVAVDVALAERTVRVVATHLEDASEDVQRAQAAELLAGPAAVAGDVVVVGDLNTDANRVASAATYDDFLGAGFVDAWTEAGRLPAEGATWGHDAALTDPASTLSQRLDLVLLRGGLGARDADVVGEEVADMRDGRWPSDHAGVVVLVFAR